jgi:hypothetical protein
LRRKPADFHKKRHFQVRSEKLAGGPPVPGTSITFVTLGSSGAGLQARGVCERAKTSFLRLSDKAPLMDSIGSERLFSPNCPKRAAIRAILH